MRRIKRFQNKCFMIVILAFLLFGCTFDKQMTDDSATGGINIKNEEDEILSEKNDIDSLERAEEHINEEEKEGEENAADETDNVEFEYRINDDFVLNYNKVFVENEVFTKYTLPDNIVAGEDIVDEYCDGFPEELQQILLYCNDSKSEGDDAWQAYLADCEKIVNEGTSEIFFEELENDVGDSYNSLYAIDIDSDGEDEYISIKSVGNAYVTQLDVIKYYNDKWHVIAHGTSYSIGAAVGILEYEGNKYILVEDTLACWNDEYDSAEPDAKKWNVMAVNREAAGYTPNELYSREEDSIDYFTGMDLENIEKNAVGTMGFGRVWECGNWRMLSVCDWEQEYDGKIYLYVVSNFFYMDTFPQDDYLLTIFEESDGCMEVVKVYYLQAQYSLVFEDNQYGPCGSWSMGGRG